MMDLSPPGIVPDRYDDFSLAERFVERFGSNLRYCAGNRTWYVWNREFWQPDNFLSIERMGQAFLRDLRYEAAAEPHPDIRRAVTRAVEQAQSQRRLRTMVDAARVDLGLEVQPYQFDADPWLLNCANGTLDLQTGELRPHRREDLIDKGLGVRYDRRAECPRWEQFVAESAGGCPALAEYFQRIAGYWLTGDASEECFFLFYGQGGNGKSTFLEIMKALLGPYSRTANFETFLRQREDKVRTDLARLCSARLVTGTEVDPGKELAEAMLKQLTGQDTVTARFLYKGEFEYMPGFKIALAVNHLPVIKGGDDGIWRRLQLVPFTIKPLRLDKALRAALKRELPGILNWALTGCLAWQRDGHLGIPSEAIDATTAYRETMAGRARFN